MTNDEKSVNPGPARLRLFQTLDFREAVFNIDDPTDAQRD
jgi:hypothetical protein